MADDAAALPSLPTVPETETETETKPTVAESNSLSETEQRALLVEKCARAAQLYAHKSYDAAAELYSEAAELQVALNGELALENADLLYAYGRCLYQVAVAKSDVLGGKVAGEKAHAGEDPRKRGVKRKSDEANGEASASAAVEANGSGVAKPKPANAPFFQIEGDDPDWSSASENDEEGEEGDNAEGTEGVDEDGTAADEEDDFATAYEILDVARVLLSRKLEAAQSQGTDTDNAHLDDVPSSSARPDDAVTTPPSMLRTIKETLADTHDLQSEISLESERFDAAVADARASLALKESLYAPDSNHLAEAHFKLSLALEFASVTQVKDDAAAAAAADGARNDGVAAVDEAARAEAATHMEHAIASARARLQRETRALAEQSSGSDERRAREREVADVRGMVEEMETRLADLRAPVVAAEGGGADGDGGGDAIRGLLGSLLGESREAQRAAIDEATRGANDLSGLVKKKKDKTPAAGAAASSSGSANGAEANGNGKRRAEAALDDAGAEDALEHGAKKAKVQSVPDEEQGL